MAVAYAFRTQEVPEPESDGESEAEIVARAEAEAEAKYAAKAEVEAAKAAARRAEEAREAAEAEAANVKREAQAAKAEAEAIVAAAAAAEEEAKVSARAELAKRRARELVRARAKARSAAAKSAATRAKLTKDLAKMREALADAKGAHAAAAAEAAEANAERLEANAARLEAEAAKDAARLEAEAAKAEAAAEAERVAAERATALAKAAKVKQAKETKAKHRSALGTQLAHAEGSLARILKHRDTAEGYLWAARKGLSESRSKCNAFLADAKKSHEGIDTLTSFKEVKSVVLALGLPADWPISLQIYLESKTDKNVGWTQSVLNPFDTLHDTTKVGVETIRGLYEKAQAFNASVEALAQMCSDGAGVVDKVMKAEAEAMGLASTMEKKKLDAVEAMALRERTIKLSVLKVKKQAKLKEEQAKLKAKLKANLRDGCQADDRRSGEPDPNDSASCKCPDGTVYDKGTNSCFKNDCNDCPTSSSTNDFIQRAVDCTGSGCSTVLPRMCLRDWSKARYVCAPVNYRKVTRTFDQNGNGNAHANTMRDTCAAKENCLGFIRNNKNNKKSWAYIHSTKAPNVPDGTDHISTTLGTPRDVGGFDWRANSEIKYNPKKQGYTDTTELPRGYPNRKVAAVEAWKEWKAHQGAFQAV